MTGVQTCALPICFHDLKTPCARGVNPARMKGDVVGQHPAAFDEPLMYRRRIATAKLLDHHEQHAPSIATADADDAADDDYVSMYLSRNEITSFCQRCAAQSSVARARTRNRPGQKSPSRMTSVAINVSGPAWFLLRVESSSLIVCRTRH